MKKTLTSHKFWATFIALVLVFFGPRAGIDGDTLTKAIEVLIAYVIGRGLSDFRASR